MAPLPKDASEGFSNEQSGCPWGGEFAVTSEKHKIMTFGDFVALEVSKDIFMIQTLHFWKKKIEFVCFPPKYAILGKKT